jgi:hypothetical protein
MLLVNDGGEREPFCRLFGEYIARISISIWVIKMLDG